MKKKIKYTNEPMDDFRVVADFMPSPEDLVFREETTKVTIALTRRSVEFFKNVASSHDTQYQKLIRRLLDEHVERQTTQKMQAKNLGKLD